MKFGIMYYKNNYSDGRASVEEMVEAAHLKGLREVAISDHGPNNMEQV